MPIDNIKKIKDESIQYPYVVNIKKNTSTLELQNYLNIVENMYGNLVLLTFHSKNRHSVS